MDKELIIITHYAEQMQIERSFISSLEEYGLIHIHEVENEQFLHSDELPQLEKYARMYYELSINLEGIDAIHHLIERINGLGEEIQKLRNRLPFTDDFEF
jgi:hypothetical protein